MGRAGKQVVQEVSDEDDVPLAQRKRKVRGSGQGPRGHGRTNPPAAFVTPVAKVTVPAPSKLINWMTVMMTMKTSPWIRFPPLSLGRRGLLIGPL
jgi:hypothetical protein